MKKCSRCESKKEDAAFKKEISTGVKILRTCLQCREKKRWQKKAQAEKAQPKVKQEETAMGKLLASRW